MQRPDPDKRRQIMAVAARLFATRPFHEVKLDDVAAAAKVGKGTVYVYFKGKEQLYSALIDEGFGDLVQRLQARLGAEPGPALADLTVIVRALLEHARSFPHLFHLMRVGQQLPCAEQLARHREALMLLCGEVVRRGVRSGELRDAHPELTAAYLPSLVRAAVLYGPAALAVEVVADHIVTVLAGGIAADKPIGKPTAARPRRAAPRPRTSRSSARKPRR